MINYFGSKNSHKRNGVKVKKDYRFIIIMTAMGIKITPPAPATNTKID